MSHTVEEENRSITIVCMKLFGATSVYVTWMHLTELERINPDLQHLMQFLKNVNINEVAITTVLRD